MFPPCLECVESYSVIIAAIVFIVLIELWLPSILTSFAVPTIYLSLSLRVLNRCIDDFEGSSAYAIILPQGDTFITILIGKIDIDYIYKHKVDDKEFTIDTRQLKEILGPEVSISNSDVLAWISEYVNEGLRNLMEV